VTDHGEEGELAYLVMELLDGESLEERIVHAAPLGLGEVSAIVTQIARALGAAHAEGFIHRDVKPGNVFLTRDEDGRLVTKLLDFGIARAKKPVPTRSPFVTAKDTIIGTPSYMSPEQARASEELDGRTDVWSLAVVAYEALTGGMPFEGETLQDVLISIGIGRETPIRDRRADLPEAITPFYAQAFAAEVEDRFPTAHALAQAFARVAGFGDGSRPSITPPPSVSPVTPAASAQPAARALTADADLTRPATAPRRRWLALAALVSLALVAAAILVLVTAPPRASTTPAPASSATPALPSASSDLPAAEPPPRTAAPATSASASAPAAQAPRRALPSVTSTVPAVAPPPPAPHAPAPARSIDRSEVF
jgi:serine/threonine-protein kinase